MYISNRWSPIHITHEFASKLHILHKSDKILYWVFAYWRCHKPDNVQFMERREWYAALFDAGLLWGLISHSCSDFNSCVAEAALK